MHLGDVGQFVELPRDLQWEVLLLLVRVPHQYSGLRGLGGHEPGLGFMTVGIPRTGTA